MFTDRAGNEAINDAARDLPVVQVLELCRTTALRPFTTGAALTQCTCAQAITAVTELLCGLKLCLTFGTAHSLSHQI
jgi:hypothetical protein